MRKNNITSRLRRPRQLALTLAIGSALILATPLALAQVGDRPCLDADGNPIEGMYVDRNGDGNVTDEDRYHYKDANPKFYFGISSDLSYKNWDLYFSGRANFGNYVYNNVSSENAVYQRLYRAEGPYLSNVTSDVTEINFVAPQYLSDYFIQEASFFKMDVISLNYLFDDIINKKVDLRISATVISSALAVSKVLNGQMPRSGSRPIQKFRLTLISGIIARS